MLVRPKVVELDVDELLFRQGLGLGGRSAKTGGVGLLVRRFREEA